MAVTEQQSITSVCDGWMITKEKISTKLEGPIVTSLSLYLSVKSKGMRGGEPLHLVGAWLGHNLHHYLRYTNCVLVIKVILDR